MKVLLELRPALDGHAGIPQAARLLFRALRRLDGVEVEGLLQSSTRLLARGLPVDGAADWPADRRLDRLSRVVVSLQPGRWFFPGEIVSAVLRLAGGALGLRQPLTRFDAAPFHDVVWRLLFARTLPPEDFDSVTSAGFRIAQAPWSGMHRMALATRLFGGPRYPRLDTRGVDVMVAETPYPGRVAPGTRLVVRYHDAIPVLMPHTIADRAHHRAAHFNALRRNVRDGAWFACVSDASRRDLLSIFPQAAPRALTIPNMVSPSYFRDEAGPQRLPDILAMRRHRKLDGVDTPAIVRYGHEGMDYLLMVSTLEPRKNHLTLLSAWEQLRNGGFPNLQLVLVGMLGWDHKAIVAKLRPWLGRGALHVLEDVPAAELRLLYRHARATVCPSYGEGFDFSGVEAMRCGCPVAASDIPVHRDVYGAAAAYFSPYAAGQTAEVLAGIIGPAAAERREALVAEGEQVAARYLPERVLPQWQAFLEQIVRKD